MADMISGLLVCSSAEQAAFKRVQDARQACLEENKRSLASRKAAIAAKHTLNATSDSISSQGSFRRIVLVLELMITYTASVHVFCVCISASA